MLKAIQSVIQATSLVSPRLSSAITMNVAAKPLRSSRPSEEQSDLDEAQKSDYLGALGARNPLWSWGEGPVVVLCHGWGGRGSQLAAMAKAIARAGYKAVVFDCSAHGDALGKRSGFHIMAQDVAAIAMQYGQVHAFVCHSMGGMSVMQARELGVDANRFVIIASPYAPLPIVEVMRKLLKAPPVVLELCKRKLAKQFDVTWDDLMKGHIYKDCDRPVLLIYDRDDRALPPNPMFHLQQIEEQCAGATVSVTQGFGHYKMLSDLQTINQVIQFLNN